MKWMKHFASVLVVAALVIAPVAAQDDDEDEPISPYTYGGSVDAYYTRNFSNPFTNTNALRAFDFEDDKIELGLVDLWVERARTPVGFRIDLQFGPTSNFVQAFDPNKSDVWDRIQQLYVTVNTNDEGTHYLDFGKWVTMHGAELIEPGDNWLYSRGLLFTWAIPFYHTGFRYTHNLNDHDWIMLNLTQGWNTSFQDNGDGNASFGISAGKEFGEWVMIFNYQGGQEPGAAPKDFGFRSLVDIVVSYDPSGKWAYVFNFDYGTQAAVALTGTAKTTDVDWYGLSAMSKYRIDARQYATLRAEVLRDDEGFLFGTPQTAGSLTLGYARDITDWAQVRLELRHDWSSFGGLFPSAARGSFQGSETTIGISTILTYQ